jgi:hypothetical protein
MKRRLRRQPSQQTALELGPIRLRLLPLQLTSATSCRPPMRLLPEPRSWTKGTAPHQRFMAFWVTRGRATSSTHRRLVSATTRYLTPPALRSSSRRSSNGRMRVTPAAVCMTGSSTDRFGCGHHCEGGAARLSGSPRGSGLQRQGLEVQRRSLPPGLGHSSVGGVIHFDAKGTALDDAVVLFSCGPFVGSADLIGRRGCRPSSLRLCRSRPSPIRRPHQQACLLPSASRLPDTRPGRRDG